MIVKCNSLLRSPSSRFILEHGRGLPYPDINPLCISKKIDIDIYILIYGRVIGRGGLLWRKLNIGSHYKIIETMKVLV